MKSSLRFTLLLFLALASCNSPNNTTVVNNSTVPMITGFSPDTVWTDSILTISGSHLGYDVSGIHVFIDTARAYVQSADDTVMTVSIPEQARSGLIHVSTINGSSSFSSPVFVRYSFSPHPINDTLPIGASFSIPGTGMNNYRGSVHLSVAGIPYPIDSVFPTRIVSHVVPNAISGYVSIGDSAESWNIGTLAITRPSVWKTLSEIWDNVNVTETHQLIRYVNGVAASDSTWKTQATFSGQHDVNISGSPFIRTSTGLQYDLSVPSLQLTWDTIHQTATIQFQSFVYNHSPTFLIDSGWAASATNTPAPIPVDGDIEFVMPGFGPILTEDSMYGGALIWQESTNLSAASGSFDLIFKQ